MEVISLKNHRLGVLFAIVAGLLVAGPNLVFTHSPSYRGLPMMYADAESYYLSRVNGVYAGCLLACNPYIREYGSAFPSFDPSLLETALAVPGMLLDIPVLKLKVFYEFLLPFLLALCAYGLVFRLTGSKGWSVLASMSIVLGSNLLNIRDLLSFIDIADVVRLKTDYTQFLGFSRPVNPQLSSLFFFAYLHVLLSAATRKTSGWFIALGFVYGASFYVYFFTYTFITVLQGIWLAFYWVRREYPMMRKSLASTIIGVSLGIPVFAQIYRLFQHPYFPTIPGEYLIRTHVPDISALGVIMFALFIIVSLLYARKVKEIPPGAYFVAALVLACFVMRNQHIVSGVIMQYDHYEGYYFTPVLVVALCWCGYVFLKNSARYYPLLLVLGLIPVINAYLIQYSSYRHWLPYAKESQKYVPVLLWLRDAAPAGVVVSAPERLSSLIPVYTHDYVLWAFFAGQWMHIPGRPEEILAARNSPEALEQAGRKYGVAYFIESRDSDLFARAKNKKEKALEDAYFVVYKAY